MSKSFNNSTVISKTNADALKKRIQNLPDKEVSTLTMTTTSVTRADLAGISADTVSSFKTMFASTRIISRDAFEDIMGIFGYEGFDPENVFRALIYFGCKAGKTITVMSGDINMMLVLHHVRGNLNDKNVGSFNNKAKGVINTLCTQYEIQRSPKGANKGTALTFPRIGAAFPLQLSVIASYAPRDYSGVFDSSDLPAFMKTSCFPSLVPAGSNTTLHILAAYNNFAADTHIVLTNLDVMKITDADKKALFMKQYPFTQSSFRSTITTLGERKYAMNFLGMGDLALLRKIIDLNVRYGIMTLPALSEAEITADIDDWAKFANHDATVKAAEPLAVKNIDEYRASVSGA